MNAKKILKKLSANKIGIEEAYDRLYKSRVRKGHFIKIQIKTDKGKFQNVFLRLLFLFPIPISFLRPFIKKKHLDDTGFSKKEIFHLIRTKDINIDVISSEKEKFILKII